MKMEDGIFWAINAGLPVLGVLLNVLVRAPKKISITFGSDLALAIGMADLVLICANPEMQRLFYWHPYKQYFLQALVVGGIGTLVVWVAMVNYLEPQGTHGVPFSRQGGRGAVQKFLSWLFAWLLVGVIFALHTAFFIGPRSSMQCANISEGCGQ